MTRTTETGTEPYPGLLTHVPPLLHPTLQRIEDARRGLAWTRKGEQPDPDFPGGVDPRRRYLQGIRETAGQERQVTFEGRECGTEELEEQSEIEDLWDTQCPRMVDTGLQGWQCLVTIAVPEGTETAPEEPEWYLLQGSYLAVVENIGAVGALIETNWDEYIGLYRTEKPGPDHPVKVGSRRCWLNLRAERLLRQALVGGEQ